MTRNVPVTFAVFSCRTTATQHSYRGAARTIAVSFVLLFDVPSVLREFSLHSKAD